MKQIENNVMVEYSGGLQIYTETFFRLHYMWKNHNKRVGINREEMTLFEFPPV